MDLVLSVPSELCRIRNASLLVAIDSYIERKWLSAKTALNTLRKIVILAQCLCGFWFKLRQGSRALLLQALWSSIRVMCLSTIVCCTLFKYGFLICITGKRDHFWRRISCDSEMYYCKSYIVLRISRSCLLLTTKES